MMTIDQFQELACEITDEIPPEFFRKLNGGIILLEQAKLHGDSVPTAPLYIMGEYTRSGMMGQSIQLYYGSFAATYGYMDAERLRAVLRKTILHEFRHHLEWLSGTRELEDEDARQLAAYSARYGCPS